ncbi:MAG: hypothetical protein PHV59_02020 [Victivallales bacterium]|nr:hypothetical protein [Victivallales bacterium]
MLKLLLKLRYLSEYLCARFIYLILKIQPRWMIKAIAGIAGRGAYCLPGVYRMIDANLGVCFPEMSKSEIKRVGRLSVINAARNLLEFFWMSNNSRRIRRCVSCIPDGAAAVEQCLANGERVVFVTAHLGSWEASALTVPFFFPAKIAIVVHPLTNPYLNKFLNSGNRKQVSGLEVIFARGAVRASLKALHQGFNIGILVDQNTKVREGGIFVNFFGLPVPCSKSPADFYRICTQEGIRTRVFFAFSRRDADGRLYVTCQPLPKPESEYDSRDMIRELVNITEEHIRRYPEQYIWLYKRFAHIPRGLDEETMERYPYYARLVKESFYSRARKVDIAEYLP